MLFHSSIRKELARSFGATLVVLVTILMTMTLIRTVGDASRGTFDPTDVMLIMGYTVLSDLPTVLALCLFLAMLNTLTRMFKDSEMVIWFNSGRGMASLLSPLFRFSWPILIIIFVLAVLVLPWAFSRIEDLRDRFEKRSDIARIEPGQFQESANGDRVFYIDKDAMGQQIGHNVFIATNEAGKQTVTSARTGSVQFIDQDRFLVLENGQRLEKSIAKADMNVVMFQSYGALIGSQSVSPRTYVPFSAKSTLDLIREPVNKHLAELSWRVGLPFTGFNLVVIALALAGVNPRVARSANLGFAFLVFVIYFNLLLLGKSWIGEGQIAFFPFMLLLHGTAFIASVLWLAKRHNAWSFHLPKRPAR